MPSYRSDMGFISFQVAGVQLDSVSWDAFDGGDLVVSSENYNPGGMAPAIALGGKRSRSDITIKRIWSDALIASYIALDNAGGKAAFTASYQTLAADHVTKVGSPIVYSGIIGNVSRPAYDSTSSSPVFLTVVCSCNEVIS